jgi:RNA polymerase sigma factor (sigma-70 family)
MNMGEDATLLRDFVESGSERAFSGLVDRHFNLVYVAALRIAAGDAHLAQDVVQSVFTDFAAKAKSLPRDLILGGWLYKHTCFIAAKAVRQEQRRRTRERQAFEMKSANEPSDPVWSRVGPVLDEAMSRLGAADRNALVLRYFEQKSFKTVGMALGISEEAARKRVDRALEKLRGFFARRGLSFSAVVLSSALDSHAAAAAPAGLSSAVASVALAQAAKSGAAGFSLLKLFTITRLMTITKAKIALSAAAVGLSAAIIIQSHENSRLQRENRGLREQTAALSEKPRTDNEPLPEGSGLDQEQFRELIRLRGQVGLLRDQLAQARKAAQANADIAKAAASKADAPPESASDDPVEHQRKMTIAKMNYTKQWMLAFWNYAGEHGQSFPGGFDQARDYFPDQGNGDGLTTNQFQVAYQGAANQITNPAQTIVLQEVEPMQTTDGGWIKVYGFADGHAEAHLETDGNFASWESQHIQPPPGQ